MISPRQEFKNWLEAEPSRKQDLPNWEEFLNCIIDEPPLLYLTRNVFIFEKMLKLIQDYYNYENRERRNYKHMEVYWNIFEEWFWTTALSGSRSAEITWIGSYIQTHISYYISTEYFNTTLQSRETTLTTTRQQLEQSKTELTQEQKKVKELKQKLANPLTEEEKKVIKIILDYERTVCKMDTLQELKEATKKILEELDEFNLKYIYIPFSADLTNKTTFESFLSILGIISRLSEELEKHEQKSTRLETEIKAKEEELKTLQQQSTTSTAQLRNEITDLKKQLQVSQDNHQTLKTQWNNHIAQDKKQLEKEIVILEGLLNKEK